MDYTIIFACLGILVIASLLLVFRLKTGRRKTKAELKGLAGEKRVTNILTKHNVKHFDDVLLQIGRTYTQIDHLVVFPNKKILVIETKNKDGKFYGDETQRQWVQQFPNQTFHFYNPILQNEGHIRFLKRFCEQHKLRGYDFINLIVFTGDRTELMDVPANVITHHQLPYYLQTFQKKSVFNHTSKFTSAIIRNDVSSNKSKVREHLAFIEQAKKHNKRK